MLEVSSRVGPAIVADKEDERILFQARVSQFRHHRSDAVIHVRQHGGKDSPVDVVDRLKLLHVSVSPLKWTVNSVVCQVEKERSVLRAIDEIHGFSSQSVRQVLVFDNRLTTAVDRVVRIIRGVRRAPYESKESAAHHPTSSDQFRDWAEPVAEASSSRLDTAAERSSALRAEIRRTHQTRVDAGDTSPSPPRCHFPINAVA